MKDQPGSTANDALRVFVSYGHDEHADLASRLMTDLQARGHEVWFDRTELRPGVDWESSIEDGLDWLATDRDKARMIVLLTPHAIRRPDGYCLNEITRAVSRRIGIIPVMVADCEPPLSICRIQHLDLRGCTPIRENEVAYRESLDLLLAAVEGEGPEADGFGTRKLKALEPIDFAADLAAHSSFVGREWLFAELEAWIAERDAPRVFVLVGTPGLGKTALAVQLIHRSQHVRAFHICVHSSQQKTDATRLVTSLAYQLSTQMPQYEGALQALDLDYVSSRYDAATLFDVLLTQPLARIMPPDGNVVVVIDGLDEATQDGRNPIAEFLADRAGHLPPWLRILVTTRPEPEVLGPLETLGLHRIEPLAGENTADIRSYLSRSMRGVDAAPGAVEHAIDVIVERCAGVMLYARAASEMLLRDGITSDTLRALPEGLGALYARQFATRCPDAGEFAATTRPLLSLILAAGEPLRFDLMCAALNKDPSDVWAAVRTLGSLVVDNGDTLTLQHKTLHDWLSDRKAANAYYVSAHDGHVMLAAAAMNWRAVPRSGRQYLFLHGPEHLLAAQRWDDLFAALAEAQFAGGRVALLDRLLRDADRLDLLLDLVEQMAFTDSVQLHDQLHDELLARLQAAIESGHWHAVEPIAEVAGGLSETQRDRLTFLRAWTRQVNGNLARSLELYGQLSKEFSDPDGFMAFRRADAVRESGGFDEAFNAYAELARRPDVPDRLSILYTQQYADLLYVRGQYVDGLAALDATIERGPGDSRDAFAESLRIRGHIHRVMFERDQSLDDYRAAKDIFSAIGHRAGVACIETNLAEVHALTDPERALWHADHAVTLNREIRRPLEAGKAIRAKGLALALLGRIEAAASALSEAGALLEEVGYAAGVCETLANRVILDVLRGDVVGAGEHVVDLADRLRRLNAYPLLVFRSCVVIASHSELPPALAELGRASADEIQWPIDSSTYEHRLLDAIRRAR